MASFPKMYNLQPWYIITLIGSIYRLGLPGIVLPSFGDDIIPSTYHQKQNNPLTGGFSLHNGPPGG